MGRPKGNTSNLTARMRAYELFATGSRRSEIAADLGVTKATITNWARSDRWEERLADVVTTAHSAAEHAVGDELAKALLRLKQQLAKRIAELELLCGPSAKPDTRLRAIQLWFKLAGADRALPSPIDPNSPKSLLLVEDLLSV